MKLRVRQYSPSDIARALKACGRLELAIAAIERGDRKRFARCLKKVLPYEDGTLTDLYLSDPARLADLKAIRDPT